MRSLSHRALLSAVAGVAVVGLAGRANAGNLTITPTYDTTVTSAPDAVAFEAAVQAAINQTLTYITTPTPVTDVINFNESTTGLGGSGAYNADIPYSTYRTFLQNKPGKSAVATAALATMPAGPATGINGNTTQMRIIPGLANLIGDTGAFTSTTPIGNIYINTAIINDSRTGTINPDNYDLQATVQHEIDELLGTGGQGSSIIDAADVTANGAPTDVGILDFFRYSAPGVRSFTNSTTATSYFSTDGGVTNLDLFNQTGGGADYADWGDKSPAVPQVQNAFGTSGVDGEVNLGAPEITAFDVAGYELTPAGLALETGAPVPEPTTLALLAVGTVGLLARRRRAAKI